MDCLPGKGHAHAGFYVAGVVSYDENDQTFLCDDEHMLERPFRVLLRRIDRLARIVTPTEQTLLLFDDRGHAANKRNSKAITNYLVKSKQGRSLTSIVPYPVFAVSEGHNYGLQMADLIAAVLALHALEDERIKPLWRITRRMAYRFEEGEHRWSTLKVLRQK